MYEIKPIQLSIPQKIKLLQDLVRGDYIYLYIYIFKSVTQLTGSGDAYMLK